MTSAPASARQDLFIAEPRGRYEPALPVVVDCSVIAAALFHEPDEVTAQQALQGFELHAPQLLASEFANVAVKKSRQGMDKVVRQALADFSELDIHLHAIAPAAQWRLAMESGVSAYDASYVCLARALRAPLVTFDRRLGQAAQALLGTE